MEIRRPCYQRPSMMGLSPRRWVIEIGNCGRDGNVVWSLSRILAGVWWVATIGLEMSHTCGSMEGRQFRTEDKSEGSRGRMR